MPGRTRAQQFQLLAGSGLSLSSARGINASYTPALLPQVLVRCNTRLSQRVALLSGLQFGYWGFNSRSIIRYEPPNEEHKDILYGRTRYQMLSVPLQLSVRLSKPGNYALSLEGGINYGFMLSAHTSWDQYSYFRERLTNYNQFESKPKIALIPEDSRIPNSNPSARRGSLYLFHPAITGAIILTLRKRILMRTFFEQHLYEASSEGGSGRLLLGMGGLMIGVGL